MDSKNTQMHLYEPLDYSINSHVNIENESEEDQKEINKIMEGLKNFRNLGFYL